MWVTLPLCVHTAHCFVHLFSWQIVHTSLHDRMLFMVSSKPLFTVERNYLSVWYRHRKASIKGTNVSFFVSLVVDKERMRSGHQLRLVICVSPWVIVLTLVIGWEEAHLVRKTLFHLSQRFHPEQVEKKDHGGTNLRGRMAAVILAVPVSLCISLSVCQYVETVGY